MKLLDLKTIAARRAMEMERTEAQIGRCMEANERVAFEIGFNVGAGLAIETMRKHLLEELGARAGRVEGGR